ncbi:MAG: response regulator transcription factor [Clostridia bacterium]|nr:response regulator transcription factor [Clostridia bacterium]
MRVLIVDDHPLFTKGLSDLLVVRGVEVVGTAKDGLEALEKAREMLPDVVLMDISMPRCDGLAATRLIKAELPEMKIIMLTASDTDKNVFEAVKSGACGYVLKDVDADELMAMLSDLERGEVAFSPGLTARILAEFTRIASESRESTTNPAQRERTDGAGAETGGVLMPRQMEVLALVASGLTYKEVGSALCISERTVKYHMKQILDQLHLQNRSQVIAYAAQIRISKFTGSLPA